MKRGVFKIAVLLTSIASSALEAATPGNVFDSRPDRVPSLASIPGGQRLFLLGPTTPPAE